MARRTGFVRFCQTRPGLVGVMVQTLATRNERLNGRADLKTQSQVVAAWMALNGEREGRAADIEPRRASARPLRIGHYLGPFVD
jgi:hypothetical protein